MSLAFRIRRIRTPILENPGPARSTVSPDRGFVAWSLVPIVATIAVFVAGLVTFDRIVRAAPTDIQLHATFIAQCIDARFFPVDFVYYLGVAAVALFSTDVSHILFASVLVLALALAAKYQATASSLANWLETEGSVKTSEGTLLLAAAGLLLVFVIPLPGFYWYLGQFPPNQWHNSTTVMVMPFAVLLFHFSSEYLRDGDRGRLLGVIVFALLNLLTKPSLFFCFAIVFPLYALARFGRDRRFALAALAVASCGLVLVLYYGVVFFSQEYQAIMGDENVHLALGWLEPWRDYSPSVTISLLNSILLPLLFLAGYPREFLADVRIRYAAAMFLVGVAIYAVVRETGDRALHGNLSWQNIISNYLLHLAVVAAYLRLRPGGRPVRRYDWALLAAFGALVVSGAAYVVRIVWTAGYY